MSIFSSPAVTSRGMTESADRLGRTLLGLESLRKGTKKKRKQEEKKEEKKKKGRRKES